MMPAEFIAKWKDNKLSERAGAQAHFLDLCELLGVDKPGDPDNYCFERGAKKTGSLTGKTGWADVWKRQCFAWEYKTPGTNLGPALKQLMTYALALDNPPLLVVSDRERIEIHTHFTGTPSEVDTIAIGDIGTPENLKKLRWLFSDPEQFKPKRTRTAITLQAAKLIGDLAWDMQRRNHDPQKVAHFLNKIIFCLFAEDAKGPASEPLLPNRLFSKVLETGLKDVERFQRQLKNLFGAMSNRHGEFGEHMIQWFNGGLFDDDLTLPLTRDDLEKLTNVGLLDWSAIEPSIFGTLFERGLDPAKRSQLGAHYTDPISIMRIVNPVIVEPLLAEWAEEKQHIAAQMDVLHQLENSRKPTEKTKATNALKDATHRYIGFKERLKNFKVLDPACGSGNFLYLALQALKDIELRVGLEAEALGLERGFPEVGPQAMHGIELSPYAAELAKVTVWIGDIQWMLKHGFAPSREPILKTLDGIQCRDALLSPPPPGEGPGVRAAQTTAKEGPGTRAAPIHNPPLPDDIKAYARTMRSTPTDAEAFVWGALRDRRMAGFKFRRQHPVGRYILDFYSHDLALAIELDGGQHQDAVPYDQTRTDALAENGIRVVRFWNNDVLANPGAVLEAIWNEVHQSPSSPALLPAGEGSRPAEWPTVDAIIGNPPFLGGSKMREQLGVDYTEDLRNIYQGVVPGGADLVCFWFAKAQQAIESGGAKRAGLVATNSIRQSTNRPVLERIVATGKIYNAWSDEEWVNEGAAVRVSILCFTNNQPAQGSPSPMFLDGREVGNINANLTATEVGTISFNVTHAKPLPENAGISFQGSQKIGAFDIDGELARAWLKLPNPHGNANSDVLKPSWNGIDLTRRPRDGWIIDFGTSMPETEAALYEAPFQHLVENVKAERLENNRESYRKNWWKHGEPRIAMRAAIAPLGRYIATPEVAKHRPFAMVHGAVLPDKKLIVIASDSDTIFGVLTSYIHECWTLALGGRHGVGNDPYYNPTLCFQTFPFPKGLTPNLKPEQYTNPHAADIAAAAKRLNELRENWLNPQEWVDVVPEVTALPSPAGGRAGDEGCQHQYPDRIIPKPEYAKAIRVRTLTNLYNKRQAGDVQWLEDAHRTLDAAVARAYGWDDYTPQMADEEILRRLLKLNLERTAK